MVTRPRRGSPIPVMSFMASVTMSEPIVAHTPGSTPPELMSRIYATAYGTQMTQLLSREQITPETGIEEEFRDIIQKLLVRQASLEGLLCKTCELGHLQQRRAAVLGHRPGPLGAEQRLQRVALLLGLVEFLLGDRLVAENPTKFLGHFDHRFLGLVALHGSGSVEGTLSARGIHGRTRAVGPVLILAEIEVQT